jgi:hypothetical protein
MVKKPQNLLLTTILLLILMISSAYASVPKANALVITSTAKGLAIISQVAGINLGNQTVTSTLDVAGSYLGVLPTENVRYTLQGSAGAVEIQDTFTNGSLQIMDVLENTASPLMPALPPISALGINASNFLVQTAKIFLINYQSYSANSLYGRLASTLNSADPNKNSTTTIGDINFNIDTISGNSAVGNSTTFTWSYTSNGVNADCKCVSLSYENYCLKSFIDTWNLYPIGSTRVNLSKQQAENIAMQNAKTYTWTEGSGTQTRVINNFNITEPEMELLEFAPAGNASNARSSDPLTLYPLWSIGVGLDKFYPGNAFGIGVNIWADTGKIRDIGAEFSTMPPPAGAAVATVAESSITAVNNQASPTTSGSNMFSTSWILPAAFVAFTILCIPIWLSRKKKLPYSLPLPKLRTIGGAALCIFVIGAASLVPAAHAGSVNIWGNDCSTLNDLYHTPNEIGNQTAIAAYLESLFQTDGYAWAQNFQGADTVPSFVSEYTNWADQHYAPSVTIWFDHGVGMNNSISQPILNQIPNWQNYGNEWHYMLCGTSATDGNPTGDVFDYQIYNYPSIQENYFSFISACLSANLTAQTSTGHYGLNPTSGGGSGAIIGMPFAWTHGATMSTNAYYDPDSNAYCYIGFPYGSASLSQETPHAINPHYPYITFGDFVQDFFYAALPLHDTVDQALDYASYTCWNECYGASTLYTGFTAYWPGVKYPTQSGCTMAVYGNGNMYLYTGSPDYVSTPSISDNVPSIGVAGTQYTFSASASDPMGYALTYTFNYGDGTGWTTQTTHTYSSDGNYVVTAKATSSTGVSSQSQIGVTIGNMLSVYAYDYFWAYMGSLCPMYPTVTIDGTNHGTAPVSVAVTQGTHTVTLSSPISDPYYNPLGYTYAVFYQMYDFQTGDDYGNGASIPVTSPSTLWAYYEP